MGLVAQFNSDAVTAQVRPPGPAERAAFQVVEKTIPELQLAMEQGRVTARDIVLAYLERIGLYGDLLNAAITVNVRALEEAAELDRERADGSLATPLLKLARKSWVATPALKQPQSSAISGRCNGKSSRQQRQHQTRTGARAAVCNGKYSSSQRQHHTRSGARAAVCNGIHSPSQRPKLAIPGARSSVFNTKNQPVKP